jgi:hypothetical protein
MVQSTEAWNAPPIFEALLLGERGDENMVHQREEHTSPDRVRKCAPKGFRNPDHMVINTSFVPSPFIPRFLLQNKNKPKKATAAKKKRGDKVGGNSRCNGTHPHTLSLALACLHKM